MSLARHWNGGSTTYQSRDQQLCLDGRAGRRSRLDEAEDASRRWNAIVLDWLQDIATAIRGRGERPVGAVAGCGVGGMPLDDSNEIMYQAMVVFQERRV